MTNLCCHGKQNSPRPRDKSVRRQGFLLRQESIRRRLLDQRHSTGTKLYLFRTADVAMSMIFMCLFLLHILPLFLRECPSIIFIFSVKHEVGALANRMPPRQFVQSCIDHKSMSSEGGGTETILLGALEFALNVLRLISCPCV